MKNTLLTLLGVVVLIVVVAWISARAFPRPESMAAATQESPATAATAAAATEPQQAEAPPPAINAGDTVQGDAAREKRVVMACWTWAQDHQQHMPDDLATLVAAKRLKPDDLVADRTGTDPLSITPAALAEVSKDHAALVKLLEPQCDYVYLGKGLGPDELKQNAITQQVAIVYEKPSAKLQGRMNIGFIDGHIQIRLISRLPAVFRLSNEFFARTHRPLIDIGAIQEAAGK